MSAEPKIETIAPTIETPRPAVPKHHWSLTLLGIALILAFVYYGELVLTVLCFSILLTFVLAPIAEGMERLRLPRGVASLAAVLLLLAAVYAVSYFSYNQAQIFADNLPKYTQKIQAMLKPLWAQAQRLEKTTEAVQEPETPGSKRIVTVRPATSWTDLLTHGFGSISEDLLAASFIPFLVYFLLTWQQHARSATVMLFPLQHRNTAFVALGLIAKMLRSFIVGNLLVGLFISGASVAVFGFLHVPFFYFIGFLSGFLSLVPYLGVVLALGPPVLVGLGQMETGDLVMTIVAVMGLHLFALNVLFPKFLGSRLKLNPLAVTIALLFWGFIWGAVGLVLAVPITAAMKIIFEHVESMRPYANWIGE
jgi:predicted PurR-regulated permease PerM